MFSLLRRTVLFAVLLVFIVHPGFSQPNVQSQQGQTHYIVFRVTQNNIITPVFHSYVTLRTPRASLDLATFSRLMNIPDRSTDRFAVELVDAANNVVYRTIAEAPRWLRGEFHAGQGIDGHFFQPDTAHFVVRVPVMVGTQLRLQGSRVAGSASFDPVAIANQGSPLAVSIPSKLVRPAAGDPANRVDLLVMGDGYTAAQEATFTSDVDTIMADFFNITPYDEYRDMVNLTSLFTASPQSGSDHPPYDADCNSGNPYNPECCSDPDAQTDALAGTYVNTAFDASFCAFMTHRLLVANEEKVFAAAAAAPDWDQILVIVNDDTYGGSGGPIGVFSTHDLAVDIGQHEYGHSFTRLADEYTTAYPGFPSCNDINANPNDDCEVNVTNQTVRELIKWNRWISGGTPIPTPETAPYLDPSVVGLFQGARYLTTGMYRSGYNCMMRSLGVPFCAVASEAYPIHMYTGGWGITDGGIDNIEPGSESHTPDTTIYVELNTIVSFSADLIGPNTTPSLKAEWFVNDVLADSVNATTTTSYDFFTDIPGVYTVRLEVTDISGIIHPSIQENYTTSRTWTLNVGGEEILVNGNFDDNDDATPKLPDGWVKSGTMKGDKVRADAAVVRSRSAPNMFNFKAKPGEGTSILFQNIDLTAHPIAVDDTLILSAYINQKSAAKNVVIGKFVIKYTDGTKKTQVKLRTPATKTPGYVRIATDPFTVTNGNIAKMNVQFYYLPTTGQYFLDDVSLFWVPAASPLTGGIELPTAPDADLRGN